MSQSIVACTIDADESSIVRLKSSTGEGRILSAYRSFPFGRTDITSPQGARLLKKLGSYAAQWGGENMAITISHDTLHPLPAYFAHNATPETRQKYSRIEAAYFLDNPDGHLCDAIAYSENGRERAYEKSLLLFYSDTCLKSAEKQFMENHPIIFKGSHILPLLSMNEYCSEPQAIIEITGDHVMLLIANGGKLNHFAYRPVNSHDEAEYFTIKELQDAPLSKEIVIQAADTGIKKGFRKLIKKETGLDFAPLSLPQSIAISGLKNTKALSSSAVKAIAAGLMALA